MNERPTLRELEKRWENVLTLTKSAVVRHPGVYRQLKSLAGDIVGNPLDIKPYVTHFDYRENMCCGWYDKHFKNGNIPDRTILK